jgi:hypothetical protein
MPSPHFFLLFLFLLDSRFFVHTSQYHHTIHRFSSTFYFISFPFFLSSFLIFQSPFAIDTIDTIHTHSLTNLYNTHTHRHHVHKSILCTVANEAQPPGSGPRSRSAATTHHRCHHSHSHPHLTINHMLILLILDTMLTLLTLLTFFTVQVFKSLAHLLLIATAAIPTPIDQEQPLCPTQHRHLLVPPRELTLPPIHDPCTSHGVSDPDFAVPPTTTLRIQPLDSQPHPHPQPHRQRRRRGGGGYDRQSTLLYLWRVVSRVGATETRHGEHKPILARARVPASPCC